MLKDLLSLKAPHLVHPEGCAALRFLLVAVPRVSRSCEYLPDRLDLHLLQITQLFVRGSSQGGGSLGVWPFESLNSLCVTLVRGS